MTEKESASRGAILCHIRCVCGWPCKSRSGGPLPAWRTLSVASPTSTCSSVKPSNSGTQASEGQVFEVGRLVLALRARLWLGGPSGGRGGGRGLVLAPAVFAALAPRLPEHDVVPRHGKTPLGLVIAIQVAGGFETAKDDDPRAFGQSTGTDLARHA